MTDKTEDLRRQMLASGELEIGAALADALGESWDTEALQRDFEVLGFMAPFVVVRRRHDGKKGSLKFQHRPRVYFGWQED
jgi:hypothetical protein